MMKLWFVLEVCHIQLTTATSEIESDEEGYDASDEKQGRRNQDGQGHEENESEEAPDFDDKQ